ncbi:Uma2 family endonuclease [Calothrix sp. 336/3]|uniref:Uma2 family endonuclease n=1 Tax=Calothrix sp. 336/3 TaxID=1337936 RepID=UPI0004E359BA|nr:Uma2 family endonuclease [Calothrix sp. 336/3]AKG21042.1 hypothetical protein IJ00_06785 [Calothrix sp. 336/3]
MISQAQKSHTTVDEYLKLELSSFVRHEYVAGQLYPVLNHNQESRIITANLLTRLRTHLHGTGYRVFSSEMRLSIPQSNIFYHPEIFVTKNSFDRERKFKTNPCLVVEVFSSTTERVSRYEKRMHYSEIESLNEYVLISQSEMKVDIYRKNNYGSWNLVTYQSPWASVDFMSVNMTMPMAEIYEDVNIK